MPYFVYNIFPDQKLECLEEHPSYKEARDSVRNKRKEMKEDAGYTVRLVHAKHTEEAERLLTAKREPRPMGEE